MNFRNYLAHIVPPWLRRYWGERMVGGSISLFADLIMEGAAQAIKAPWLRSNTSPDDALPLIGTERSIPKVDGETAAQYRARLIAAWDLWERAGTTSYPADVLAPWGFDSDGVFVYSWHDGDEDAASTHWSKFWVVAVDGTIAGGGTVTIPFDQAIWATMPLTWGAGTTWGSSATEAQVRGMCSHLWHFKAGHEVPAQLRLVYGYTDPDPIWGLGGDAWAADAVRIPLGSYWGAHHPWGAYGVSVAPREPTVPAVWGVRFHS